MSRAPRLTTDQVDRILELREERRWSTTRIARAVGCCEGSVGWTLLKHGLDIFEDRPLPPVPAQPIVIARGRGELRRFTQAEDALLLALDAQGLGPTEIGRRLGRRWNAVIGRLRTLARREARAERQQSMEAA